ncbi:hypothetical protein [Xanthomonas citri]|uniref:hypothetical protein n=1 Tax=Xanthomonas citri TaxID=346 RepID=UPI000A300130|nr:hypothetical protein [Xanthomonas citri]ARR15219.1 hypothetical protein B7L66_21295 [Xanthomonas citri pv. citri]
MRAPSSTAWPTKRLISQEEMWGNLSYRIHLNEVGQAQLQHEHPDFYEWCQRRIRHAMDNPMSDDDRELLGLNGANEK